MKSDTWGSAGHSRNMLLQLSHRRPRLLIVLSAGTGSLPFCAQMYEYYDVYGMHYLRVPHMQWMSITNTKHVWEHDAPHSAPPRRLPQILIQNAR